jgi:glycosyltransferase involved in cell wall biosynthesis
MPKSISVCAWTYNQENFVKPMMESVLHQKSSNFHLIIADDCSTDGTPVHIENYSHIYKGLLTLVQPEKNIGAASDFCISKAPKVDYIAFMDGDDQWLPEKLEKSIAFLEENNYDMVCTDVMSINPAGEHLGRALDWMNLPQTLTIKELSVDNRIYTSTVVAKMGIILKSPGFLGFGYKVLLDYPLFLWLAARYKIGYLNEALTYKMQNTNSVLHHSNTKDIGIWEYGHQKMNMAQIISTTGRK